MEKEYIIDIKNNDKYIVVYKGDKEFCKMSKSVNKLEDVVRFIGFVNVKEVIK